MNKNFCFALLFFIVTIDAVQLVALNTEVRQLSKELGDLQMTVGDNCKELDCVRKQFSDDGE